MTKSGVILYNNIIEKSKCKGFFWGNVSYQKGEDKANLPTDDILTS